MKHPSTTFCINGRTYTFTPGQQVTYLFRLGTRHAPPLSCEARVSFVSTAETGPLIRLEFLHPRLLTEETRWLTGNQLWRASPGPAEEWLVSQTPLSFGLARQERNAMSPQSAVATLWTGKRLSRRLGLLRGRDLLHLLTVSEQVFLTQGYGSVRRYYLGPFLPESGPIPSWQEQQARERAFGALRREAGLSAREFALLDAALLELLHEEAIESLLDRACARRGKSGT